MHSASVESDLGSGLGRWGQAVLKILHGKNEWVRVCGHVFFLKKEKKKKKKRGPGIEEAWGLTSWSLAESMTETSEATAQSHNSPLAQRGAISKTCEAAA